MGFNNDKTTMRLLLFWECNLKCSYCCNEIPEIRKGIEEINPAVAMYRMGHYDTICISGGEPFLQPDLVEKVLSYGTLERHNVYIYTNGTRCTTQEVDRLLFTYPQIKGINIGLHDEYKGTWDKLIEKFKSLPRVRFHVDTIHAEHIAMHYPELAGRFKFWAKNDCEMDNEDQYVLKSN